MSPTICPTCLTPLIVESDGEVVYCPYGHLRQTSGESALEIFDAIGSEWIREELDNHSRRLK